MFSVQIKKRTPYREALDIIYALYVREAKKRFGGLSFGMLWAIAEPVVHVAIFTVIFGLKKDSAATADTPLMILSGIIPFLLFRTTLKQVMTSASGNKAVFGYPIIRPMHTVIARMILDFVVLASSMIVIYLGIMIAFDYHQPPVHPEIVILSLGAASLFGAGLGLFLMILRTFWSGTDKMINMLLRPLYFMSGIFFSANHAPAAAIDMLKANPVFHILELCRHGMYGEKLVVFDGYFLSGFIAVSLFIGFYLHTIYDGRVTK